MEMFGGVKASRLSHQLRDAIRECGESRYALAKRIAVGQATLSRFMSGERGLRLDVIDGLAEVLDLELRPRLEGRRK